MAVLLCVCMVLVPMVIGNGILIVLYGKKQENTFLFADSLLLGMIAVLGTAEAAHMCAMAAKLSFSASVKIFGGLTAAFSMAAIVLILVRYFRAGRSGKSLRQAGQGRFLEKMSGKFTFPSVLFVLLVVSQAVYIVAGGSIYLGGDMTVETVESFLYTDGIYQVNPLTGAAYQGGIPLRLEILCLPTLYGALSQLSGLAPRFVVWTLVPVMTLLFSYSAFICLGGCLFPAEQKKREAFLLIVALILWAGGYHYVMDGFGVLYSGFRGVVIRNVALMPYLLSLCLRRRRLAVFLCIAAEVCIVWTLYGAGICLLTSAAMAICSLAERRLVKTGGGDEVGRGNEAGRWDDTGRGNEVRGGDGISGGEAVR